MYKFNKQDVKMLFEKIKKYVKDKITSNRISEILKNMPEEEKINFQFFPLQAYSWLDTNHIAGLKSSNKITRKVENI